MYASNFCFLLTNSSLMGMRHTVPCNNLCHFTISFCSVFLSNSMNLEKERKIGKLWLFELIGQARGSFFDLRIC